jgi:hypothetical protein
MKQQVTLLQWDDLNTSQKKKYWGEAYHHNDPSIYESDTPNIGQMIEFLGDELILRNQTEWCGKTTQIIWMAGSIENLYASNEICDALWKAVKYKLTK